MTRASPQTKPDGAYHHGSLRAALIAAATSVLEDRGVTGFSLRETARRAGVSAAAPKHHFSDTRALLTELATIAFTELADRLEAADRGCTDQTDCLLAQGRAYLAFALDNRALFGLMWQAELLDFGNAELMRQKDRAFAALDRRVRGDDAPTVADDAPEMAPTFACWSVVHGFAHMAIEGSFGSDGASARATAEAMLPRSLTLLIAPNFGAGAARRS